MLWRVLAVTAAENNCQEPSMENEIHVLDFVYQLSTAILEDLSYLSTLFLIGHFIL